MATRKKNSAPASLPMLAHAEAAYAERRQQVGLALMRVEADLHLREFVLWVFNVTSGGVSGALVKSHRELAQRPWGLCCSQSKARATASKAKRLGLVCISENPLSRGGQSANAYTLDWDGVKALLTGRRKPKPPLSPQDTPLSPQDTPLSPQDTPYKDKLPFSPLFSPPPPPSPPPAESAPADAWVAVEVRLARLGMADAPVACQVARRREVAPDYVSALIDHYEAAPGSWGVGALHFRIRSAAPGQRVQQGWPPAQVPHSTKAGPTPDQRRQLEDQRFYRRFRALRDSGMTPEVAQAQAREELERSRSSIAMEVGL